MLSLILLAGTLLVASCATMPDITPAIRADLAPTGKLRVGINYGNFILAQKDKTTSDSRGVAVDLANDIGRRLGVPVTIIAFDSVAALGDAAPTNVWDIAFLGSDPQREKIMSFTPAYLELNATYLVPGASALKNAADVDRAGLRVSAPARANYELYLQRNLKNAKLLSVAGNDAAFALLAEGKAAGLAYLRSVVEDAKTSGLVARAIEKTGARGVAVAPPAK